MAPRRNEHIAQETAVALRKKHDKRGSGYEMRQKVVHHIDKMHIFQNRACQNPSASISEEIRHFASIASKKFKIVKNEINKRQMVAQTALGPNTVLWLTDDAYFHKDGSVTRQNDVVSAKQNTHRTAATNFHSPRVTVCFAITRIGVLGPFFTRNGTTCLKSRCYIIKGPKMCYGAQF